MKVPKDICDLIGINEIPDNVVMYDQNNYCKLNEVPDDVEFLFVNTYSRTGDIDYESEQKITKEENIMLYQIQKIRIGGRGICILPRYNLNMTNQSNIFKSILMNYIYVKKIICLNTKVFTPLSRASVIIFERSKFNQVNYNVEIIDYSHDGHIIANGRRIMNDKADIKIQKRDLHYYNNWNFI